MPQRFVVSSWTVKKKPARRGLVPAIAKHRDRLTADVMFPRSTSAGCRAFIGGEARTIIPATATAEIDIRLVKETPAARRPITH